MAALQWVAASNGDVPADAVAIGQAGNGETMYVGRAVFLDDLIPGKIIPSLECCYVGCYKDQSAEKNYEALVNPGNSCKLAWITAENGKVPPGAVEGGKVTATNEILYIARGCPPGAPAGTLHGGKVHPSLGCAWISWGKDEHKMINYEVLCCHE